MLVVFVNAHRHSDEGNFRFKKYYEGISKLLKQTIYYGKDFNQVILPYDGLKDYLYDQITYRVNENSKKRFEAVQYLFIDGCVSFMPWDKHLQQLSILITMAKNANKKMHCNGLSYFMLYFKLCTNFDKFYTIRSTKKTNARYDKALHIQQSKFLSKIHMKQNIKKQDQRQGLQRPIRKTNLIRQQQQSVQKQLDYEFQPSTGNFLFHGIIFCSSGIIKNSPGNLQFASKSSQALGKGLLLSTRFDYVAFDARSGSKMVSNVVMPFSFYWKSHLFCVPTRITRVKVETLLETEGGNPLAFTLNHILATQSLDCNMLTIIRNWMAIDVYGCLDDIEYRKVEYRNVAIDNQIRIDNSMRKLGKTRPNSVLVKKKVQKNKLVLKEAVPLFGKSRMIFCGKLDQGQIKNYVQRTPCRPASSHKFREPDKNKWVSSKDFRNC